MFSEALSGHFQRLFMLMAQFFTVPQSPSKLNIQEGMTAMKAITDVKNTTLRLISYDNFF